MTINTTVLEFETDPYLKINDFKVKVRLDWVSHGNFSLKVGDDGLYLEVNHSKEILQAFETCEKPSWRTPFWTGVIPKRGWDFCSYLLEAYACDEKFIKLISSSCSEVLPPHVPHYHSQMLVSTEVMKIVRDAIDGIDKSRLIWTGGM